MRFECCGCWVVHMCMCVFLGKGYFICVVVILLVLIKYTQLCHRLMCALCVYICHILLLRFLFGKKVF